MKRALLLTLLLAGCGGAQAAPRKPAPLAAMHVFGAKGAVTYCDYGVGPVTERDAIRRFNVDQSALHVTYLAVEPGDQRVDEDACDLVDTGDTTIAAMAARGEALDITPYVETRRSEFFPVTLKPMRYAGRDWGVPNTLNVRLLYLRGTAPPKTWQDLYSSAGEDGILYPADDGGALSAFLELSFASGGQILSADARRSALDSPANLRALELLAANLRNETTIEEILGHDRTEVAGAYERGFGTYMLNWALPQALKPSAGGERITIAPLPTFAGGKRATVISNSAIYVSRRSHNRDGALKVLDYLTSPGAMRAQAADQGVLSPLRTVYGKPGYDPPGAAAVQASMAFAQNVPVTPFADGMLAIVERHVVAVLHGEETPADALTTASTEIKSGLAQATPGKAS